MTKSRRNNRCIGPTATADADLAGHPPAQDHGEALGAIMVGGTTCQFRVWAPNLAPIHVRLPGANRVVPMQETERGYHEVKVEGINPGDLYFYQLNPQTERADPASRFQPEGVHGPSQVVDRKFRWDEKGWSGLPLQDYIIYELHVGTFTPTGTFAAIIAYLEYLIQLGITAIELMPVAQFPGGRNWGYDGVFPFAVQNSYGGPQGLKQLINVCHQRGLAVILDVVYNHLGPEGNYFADFGPYFTDRYRTPWGPALNFDASYSDEVRNYFIQNALYWITEFHIDALRLDAVHAILDHAPISFLEDLRGEVCRAAERLNRQIFLIAESADNNARLVLPREQGGYGLDALWNDDFHHCLHVLLTGECSGYYEDYGGFSQFIKAYRDGFAFCGEYSRFRRRRHGSPSNDIPSERFVVFSQNHDQVGNRRLGDRLSQAVTFEDLKLAAGLVILSPFIPLLFMGEEYGETSPFPYFVSHSDADLIEAVRRGRALEFSSFQWQSEVPNPQDGKNFLRAKLDHEMRNAGEHMVLLKYYRQLISLRKTIPTLGASAKNEVEVIGFDRDRALAVHRRRAEDRTLLVANLSDEATTVSVSLLSGRWRKAVDSADQTWRGAGGLSPQEFDTNGENSFALAARSCALFVRDRDEPGTTESRSRES